MHYSGSGQRSQARSVVMSSGSHSELLPLTLSPEKLELLGFATSGTAGSIVFACIAPSYPVAAHNCLGEERKAQLRIMTGAMMIQDSKR